MSLPDRLTCEQVFLRLDDYLDRELSAEEMRLVHEHLETCAVCAGEYRFEAGVISGLREKLRRIDVPISLRAKISALLAGELNQKGLN
jgi:anti-sigma factor (TIGR02949 family)